MRISIYYFVSMICFVAPVLASNDRTCNEQELSIDEEIRELENLRIKILGQADMLEDDALRWQTIPEQFNEMRHAYAQATEYRRQAELIEERIETLKRRKLETFKNGSK